MSFAHLHVHSTYSIPDGMSSIDELFRRASELGQPGLALTDHGYMYGIPQFLKCAKNYPDVKPIIGCEVYLTDHYDHTIQDFGHRKYYHLVLLAKNITGYRNLVKICSVAATDGLYNSRPRISHEFLQKHHDGIIALSACIGGEIPQNLLKDDLAGAEKALLWYKEVFGEDFYLEVSLHQSTKKDYHRDLTVLQGKANEGIFKLGKQYGVKVVATNDVHFVYAEDALSHDVLLCIKRKQKMSDKDRMQYTGQEFMKSESEMLAVFPDHPEAIANTMEVLGKVERYDICNDRIIPEGNDNERLGELAFDGLSNRLEIHDLEREWLTYELDIVRENGYAGYFLTVKRIIDQFRDNGLTIGPGRGAAPSSLLCYALGLTDINPVEHHLLTERFIRRGQFSFPGIDFDLSFPSDEEEDNTVPERVLPLLAELFGRENVSLVQLFGKHGQISLRKDISRAMKSYDAKEIELVSERLISTVSEQCIHSCATLICGSPLVEIMPMEKKESGLLTSQYDAHYVEESGALKLNFLRLSVLDILKHASMKYALPVTYNDPKVFDVFAQGDTAGIFLYESDGMKQWLTAMKPGSLEELAMLNAMYRPGTMDYLPFIIAGKMNPGYRMLEIPSAVDILEETYGVLVYQEQLMVIARSFGFSYDETDMFRVAFSSKNKDIQEQMRPKFFEGGIRAGVSCEMVNKLWVQLMAYGGSLFLKSHSVSYSTLAYKVAWLKAYHPKDFYEISLEHCIWEDNRRTLIEDALAHGIVLSEKK